KTLVLGSNSGTSGLTCTNGALFYDSTANRFKGCESSAWITLDNYADLQSYASSGNWTKPANVTAVEVIMVGGGGGGGGAANKANNTERNGGGAGGGGAYVTQIFDATDITGCTAGSGSQCAATVGAAGSSGAGGGAGTAANGSAGGAGGN